MRIISDDKLVGDLEVLRHGGADALARFTEVARALFETGGPEQLRDWVNVAAPALPELDRNAIISVLMRIMFDEADKAVNTRRERRTLH